MEGRRQWQVTLGKMKKEIETEVQKLNETILQKKKVKTPRSPKKKTDKRSRDKSSDKYSSPRTQNMEIDWIQLLPVWTVKKIFSYLDNKNLTNLKRVNNYWSFITKEVIAEQKKREHLDFIIKKSEEFLDHLLGTPISKADLVINQQIVTENTSHRKRIEKQRRTGTTIKKFYHDPNAVHTKTLLPDCFNLLETEFEAILANLKHFPVEVPAVVEPEIQKVSSEPIDSISVSSKNIGDDASHKQIEEESLNEDLHKISLESVVPSIIVTFENMDTW